MDKKGENIARLELRLRRASDVRLSCAEATSRGARFGRVHSNGMNEAEDRALVSPFQGNGRMATMDKQDSNKIFRFYG
jgi:hypothetical protein